MKQHRKRFYFKLFIIPILCLIMLASVSTSAYCAYSDLNSPEITVKQEGERGTCTLCSAIMLLRRAAIVRGDTNWRSITKASTRPIIWSGGGLKGTFTYSGITVTRAALSGTTAQKTQKLISLLQQHPEGIILHHTGSDSHAVLLSDYTNGTFYAFDTVYSRPDGRIPLSQCYVVTVANSSAYWYVSSSLATNTATGQWVYSGSKKWFRHPDGSYTTSGWETIEGKQYLFDAAGWVLTGWQQYDGVWYYLNSDGSMATDTWIDNYYVDKTGQWTKTKTTQKWILSSNGKWWYRHEDGSYTTSAWELINGKWYHFDEDGWAEYGWINVKGFTYYLGSSNDCAMKSGWQYLDTNWYYFGSANDGSMKTGWQKVNNKWYYMYDDGKMAADTWIDIYYVDHSGAWTQTKSSNVSDTE